MSEQKENNLPTSLTSITQWDDQSFFQYLEGCCSKVEKKKRESIQRQRKINFFIQEEPQNNQIQENAFQQNFLMPSINFFSQSKEPKVTVLGSRKELEIKQEYPMKIQTIYFKQQFSYNNQGMMPIQSQPISFKLRANQTKNINDIKTKKFNREKRLNQIIVQTTSIKEQIQSTITYFMEVINKTKTNTKLQSHI